VSGIGGGTGATVVTTGTGDTLSTAVVVGGMTTGRDGVRTLALVSWSSTLGGHSGLLLSVPPASAKPPTPRPNRPPPAIATFQLIGFFEVLIVAPHRVSAGALGCQDSLCGRRVRRS
jgi:hypothetical protein